MVSKQLLETGEIIAIRIFLGTTTMDILSSECEYIALDKETGGIWYKLKQKVQVVPMNESVIYVSPSGYVSIAFKAK